MWQIKNYLSNSCVKVIFFSHRNNKNMVNLVITKTPGELFYYVFIIHCTSLPIFWCIIWEHLNFIVSKA